MIEGSIKKVEGGTRIANQTAGALNRIVEVITRAASLVGEIARFYEHLESGGYLFIGHSESLNRETTRLRYIMPAVYRKE